MRGIVLCFICNACSNSAKNVEDSSIRQIDVMANLTNTQTIYLSEIASSIEYIALESDKKCLVSPTMSIYCSKEHVVAIGNQTVNHAACYVFCRKTGKFVREISRPGRGPGEYGHVYSHFWDENREQICVGGNNQIIFFNLDGTLSHQSNLFKAPLGIFVAFDNYYVAYHPNRSGSDTLRLSFYDKRGNLTGFIPNFRSWERINTWTQRSGIEVLMYVYDNNLYFKEIYCDTLFHIKDFTLQPRYVFNTNGLSVPYKIQEDGRWDILGSIRSGRVPVDRYERYIIISNILENSNNLFFSIEHRQHLYPAIYNKANEKIQIMLPVFIPPPSRNRIMLLYGFENDLDGGLPFWPQQMISDKEMMCVYTAEELLELDASKITDEKLKKLLNDLNEESNPVVVIVTLKE